MKKIDCFFKPKSVAIIGASRNPKKIGHVILRNFLEGGFKGKVFPINPNAEKLLGHTSYPSVLEVKEKIDLAVISLPASLVPKVLEECGKKKIPASIIISGGFKERGNLDLERKTEEIIKKYKIRVIGPNCLGVFDPYSGIDTIFNPRYKLERAEKGDIAFISQSGATMSIVLDWMAMKGYRVSKAISYGNRMDVDEADLIHYLAKDKRTKVICIYIEGLERGRKFFKTAKKFAKKKPIIILKAGTTEAGRIAAISHTGSLAGSPEVYKAVFKQTGVIEAGDLEQIFDFARILSSQPLPRGNKIQIITDGGGFGVLTADWIVRNGLKVAKMSEQNLERIKKIIPPHAGLEGMIDLTGDATTEMYRVSIESALDDKNVDMIALITLFQVPLLTTDVVEVIIEGIEKRKKPIVVIAAGGSFTEVLKKSLEGHGVPCFSYPERAVEAMKALYEYAKLKLKLKET
jgi:acetyl coenzyme A synthetase (ADP forming)-like protein